MQSRSGKSKDAAHIVIAPEQWYARGSHVSSTEWTRAKVGSPMPEWMAPVVKGSACRFYPMPSDDVHY